MDAPQVLLSDRYRLVRVIAAGGMGVVWEGWDELLERQVAVKQLRTVPGISEEETELAKNRAMREARIAARLHHPNAVPVFDAVEQQGQPCLVMQYVPSTPLSALIRDSGPLAPRDAARIGAQVASALAAAHRIGIVHRDVKPGNVLLAEEDGTALISDFGISRAMGDATLTSTGLVHGTPAFLAPEVARGEDSSFPSDVFSLGSTLYAAVEGEPPFGSDANSIAVLHRVAMADFPPPRRAGALTPLLLEMLSAEPRDRPRMNEVAARLAQLRSTAESEPTTLPLPGRDAEPESTVAWDEDADRPTAVLPVVGAVVGAALAAGETPAAAAAATEPDADAEVQPEAEDQFDEPEPRDEPESELDDEDAVHEGEGFDDEPEGEPDDQAEAPPAVLPMGEPEPQPEPVDEDAVEDEPVLLDEPEPADQDAELEPADEDEEPEPVWQPAAEFEDEPERAGAVAAPPALVATAAAPADAPATVGATPGALHATGAAGAPAALADRPAGPVPPDEPSTGAGDEPPNGRRTVIIVAIIALIVLALLLAAGFALIRSTPTPTHSAAPPAHSSAPATTTPSTTPSPTASPTATPTPSPTATASPSPTATSTPTPSNTAASGTPTAGELAQAITSYFALLPDNTDAAWQRLTPSFQQGHAEGRDYFESFWGQYRNVTASDVSGSAPDSASATITYTANDGSTTVEHDTFRLVRQDGVLKIDSQSTG